MTAIRRLLVANRGEIAARIARTAHRLGISTVGVYSEPDRKALHVDTMDRAVALGGVTPADSYLDRDAVIAAAVDSGCDALHPGYGFLAENASFAEQVTDAGLRWVGPTADQIRLLGDKVAAKRAAAAAGVPTTGIQEIEGGTTPPGVPMPALVKAAAGGGGRGMRIVRSAGELAKAIESASREAESAFGDGTVFIEPFIERGRHVEVQIIGDTFGNVIHLGERECSIQRRNQKILEEAPSPSIDPATRSSLCEGALALARHVGYQNAGTVEFLVGADGQVTFLEVNTRLQVEHPVTEAVTGLDLVELQLRVASGEPLPIRQEDVRFAGHSIEVRLVAEDPAAAWLPSTGAISLFDVDADVRTDSGVRTGSVVSADYDSLLAKVIAHAPTRGEAARRLARALRHSAVDGVRTNLAASVAILESADFADGATTTAFLEDNAACLHEPLVTGDDLLAHAVAAAFAVERRNRGADSVTGFAPSGWRNLRTRGQRQTWLRDGPESEVHQLEYRMLGGDRARVWVGPWPEPDAEGALGADDRPVAEIRILRRDGASIALEVDGVRHLVEVTIDAPARSGELRAHTRSAAGSTGWTLPPIFEEQQTEIAGSGPVCPLPGTVIAVEVEPGQQVADGDLLVVIEAMKMEHRITATGAAVVTAVRFAVGERVDAGDLLVELDAG